MRRKNGFASMMVRRKRVVSGLSSGTPRVSGCLSQRIIIGSHELQPPCGERHHTEQQPGMSPALNIGRAVGALTVPNGQVDDAQREPCRAEQQVEVPERVEVAEVGTVGSNPV